MPDIKNYDKNEIERDLKRADAEKSGGINAQLTGINIQKPKKNEETFKARSTARKRLPVAVDILIAILFVALFAGAVVGGYYAFRYFAVDYETAEVEYTVAVSADDYLAMGDSLVQKNVYYDVEGSLEYFGKVKSAGVSETEGIAVITVVNTVKYKEKDGYSVGDVKLAVGQSYKLRIENGEAFDCTVVELNDLDRSVKSANEEGGK